MTVSSPVASVVEDGYPLCLCATSRPAPPHPIFVLSVAFVAWGMDRELREVFRLVRSRLEEMAEEEDAD
jgi:hypothetical protein